jgi:hypothetical protein
MKFAHIADAHLGGWREPRLRDLGIQAFIAAIDACIEKNVDFVLFAGDLFNTSLPPIDVLQVAVAELKRLKDAGIGVYAIPGSHDFSPSGKTMFDVLEEAELLVNVCKGEVMEGRLNLEFTVDNKTGAKITGMIGKKGMLERKYYENLIKSNLEEEEGFKIFMFHTALSELKPAELDKMDAAPLSLLPKGFDYYAGGHVHIVKEADIEAYRNIIYPGPVFPNTFSELEKMRHGGFYTYDDGKIEYNPLMIIPAVPITIDCGHKTPVQATEETAAAIRSADAKGAIVLLRMQGTLESGRTSDIDSATIISAANEKGAYLLLKNTNKLASMEFETAKPSNENAYEAERSAIEENIGRGKSMNLSPESERELVKTLIAALDIEKEEGEKQSDYETRITESAQKAVKSHRGSS